jgi:hypothetical protein
MIRNELGFFVRIFNSWIFLFCFVYLHLFVVFGGDIFMRYIFKDPMLRRNQFRIFDALSFVTDDPLIKDNLAEELERLDPNLLLMFSDSFCLSDHQRLQSIYEFFKIPYGVLISVAAPRAGKSAFAYSVTKRLSQSRVIVYIGDQSPRAVPSFATHVKMDRSRYEKLLKENKSLADFCPPGSIAVMEEIAHLLPKGSADPADIERLTTTGHNDVFMWGLTQNTALISIDLLRFVTGLAVLPTTRLQADNDRKQGVNILNVLNLLRPNLIGTGVFYCGHFSKEFIIPFRFTLEPEYENNFSKSFRRSSDVEG